MHLEIFNEAQKEVLPYLKQFKRNYCLVGGTAIALHLGHRYSIDFNLFTQEKIRKNTEKAKIAQLPFSKIPIYEDEDQIHLIVNGVKLTFYHYPYPIIADLEVENTISIPSLLTLAAMKAFALGRRAKWKDYFDLFLIIKDHYSIDEISEEAERIFGDMYSAKLFRQQLSFHKDIDYSESIDFIANSYNEKEVKDFLIEKAICIF